MAINVDLLKNLMEAITAKGEDGSRSVVIGIPEKAGEPARLITEDGRGLGLLMPRKNTYGDETSEAWNRRREAIVTAIGIDSKE